MDFVANLRLSQVEKKVKDDKVFYIGRFLDDNDNKFQFFINEDKYNDLAKKRKYEPVELTLNLYESKNGRYGLGVI